MGIQPIINLDDNSSIIQLAVCIQKYTRNPDLPDKDRYTLGNSGGKSYRQSNPLYFGCLHTSWCISIYTCFLSMQGIFLKFCIYFCFYAVCTIHDNDKDNNNMTITIIEFLRRRNCLRWQTAIVMGH